MALSTSEFNFIKALVLQLSGNALEQQRDYLVESRLLALATRESLPSVQAIIQRLRDNVDPELGRRVAEALVNNETFFFRDIHPFDILRNSIFPDIISKGGAEKSLSIWCAACSSGQEPYSIAMLLRDSFPNLANWTVRLMASDFSQPILQRAALGKYTQIEVNRGLPARYLVKYFEREGMVWQLKREVRDMVTFREVNLAQPLPSMPRFDVVFLRNALIYFDVDKKREAMAQVEKILKPGGYMFLGAAETTINLNSSFDRRFDKAACYQLRAKG